MSVPCSMEMKFNRLNSRLFEWMMTETPPAFEQFLVKLMKEMKDFMHAEGTACYMFHQWRGVYQLYRQEDTPVYFHHSFAPAAPPGQEEQMPGPSIKGRMLAQPGHHDQVIVLPLKKMSGIVGYLAFTYTDKNSSLIPSSYLKAASESLEKVIEKADNFYTMKEEKKMFERLLNVTAHFHSSIDIQTVLKEIIATLSEVYPSFQYHLHLSQEFEEMPDLPVYVLSYNESSSSNTGLQAFITGEFQIIENPDGQQFLLYAPLKGRQGVYGVLQITIPYTLPIRGKEVEFFIQIADTAGKAFENARLYEQARKQNNDLQIITAASQRLNSYTKLSEKAAFMVEQIQEIFQADEAGFLTYAGDGGASVLEGSSNYFTSIFNLEEVSAIRSLFERESGPVFISDLHGDGADVLHPYRSLMAVPMKDHHQQTGFAVVLHKKPSFFSFDSFKLLQSLVQHSALAFANSILQEELERAVITDYLTKLHSRIYLDHRVEKHIKEDEQGHLILIDIDHFKAVNDTYGHQTGDEVICQAAAVIQEEMAGSSGLAARWGGEELAVYFPSISSGEAYQITESIRERIASETHPGVTVSCGFSSWKAIHGRPERKELILQADRALYQAKKAGRNCIKKNDPGILPG
ncbi:sensor domain-containing diguanylate cyclase [Halobacillus kuroshimensis]|uniref:sensor domain-containing diguanylate cyclase n=1 Tax=Halobacillus kuroshimensis TaxID=302481 RepID=UPI00146CE80A|nr:sensor domain-containing diguanylate cyclase [Halobacillus kuroshimensis]